MRLYEHQKQALIDSEGRNRVAFFHDMGLGKTYTGAEKMMQLGAKVNLVICQKSKIEDWMQHFISNYKLTVYDLSEPKELELFMEAATDCLDWKLVGVVNYELAWRRPELSKLRNFTLMLDESSLIQNRKAKQTKFILKLQPENVILLSGTPTSGKYENLWTQMHLLGWDISERLYQQQYVNWDKLRVAGGQIVNVVNKNDPYKNVERLKRKMREHGAQFLKTEDIVSLPEQTFIDIRVLPENEYRIFMQDSIVRIGENELIGDTNLTKRLRARELCSSYSLEKANAFRDLLDSTNDRLIVFYNFKRELEMMGTCLIGSNRHLSWVNGEDKNLSAYEEYDDSVTLVQYQAGSKGLNLQKANKIVYYSPTVKCDDWMQSQKRIHRIGQNRPCFYYKLICKGTIEEDIYSALERGVDYTDELFREVTLQTKGAD